ncbi:hypothetical protein D9M72_535690 [compost metagenome]
MAVSPGHVYTLRRSVPSPAAGSGIGFIIWERSNISVPFLPYTNGNITILHSKFYAVGGFGDPNYITLPLIDFVYRPN